MKKSSLAAVMAISLFATSAAAQSIQCGETYVAQEGDTLRSISLDAYGRGAPSQLLFSANAATLKPGGYAIEPGTMLAIPCFDGLAGVSQAAAPKPVERRTAGSLRIVVSPDWRPFMNKADPNGGMLAHLITAAFAATGGNTEINIDFVDDRSAHLAPLVSEKLYDLSPAWTRPDCETVGKADTTAQSLCAGYSWSDPFFEAAARMYVRRNDNAAAPASFTGQTICVPKDVSSVLIEKAGLNAVGVKLIRPTGARACTASVASGEAFGAFASEFVMNGAITASGLGATIVPSPHFRTTHLLHAVTAADHPERLAIMGQLNRGLSIIRQNGVWFRIVDAHLKGMNGAYFSHNDASLTSSAG